MQVFFIRVKQINPNELSGFFVDSISSESGLLLDLAEQAALNIFSSGTVLLTGNQTISGVKTFATGIIAPNLIYNTGNQTISGNKTFANNLNVSGDLTVAGTLRYNEIIDTTVTGNISGYTGIFQQVYANNLVYNTGNQTISGQKWFVYDDPRVTQYGYNNNYANLVIAEGYGPAVPKFKALTEYRPYTFGQPSYYYSGIGSTTGEVQIYFDTGDSRWKYYYGGLSAAFFIAKSPVVTPGGFEADFPLKGWTDNLNQIVDIKFSAQVTHNESHASGERDALDPNSIGAVALTGNQSIFGIKTFSSRPTINNTGVFLSGESILANQISNSSSAGQILLTGTVQTQRDALSIFPSYSNYRDLVLNGPKQTSRIYTTTDNFRTYVWVPSQSQYIEASPSNLFINPVVNSDFSNLNGLTGQPPEWWSGVATGWSGVNNPYTIYSGLGTNNYVANVAALATGPSGNSFRQNLGRLPITSDVKLTFTLLNSFPAFGTPTLNAAIYDSNYNDLATGSYTTATSGTFTLTGNSIPANTNIIIGFWATAGNPALDNVFIENTYTNVASVQDILNLSGVSVLTFGNQTISGIKTFANGSNQILNTTYSTLTGLKATSGLLSGQLYRISDFVLKWNNQSINDQTVKTAVSGEPLIVTALSNNKIYHIAQSETYPQDTIYYNIDASGSYSWGTINNNASIPDFKGWIYRRVDNLLDIDIAYDWRNITVNCCKPDVSSVPNYSGNYQYSRLNFVKETGNNSNRGKLYYSVVTGNSGNALDNNNFWLPVSDFVESGTFFSTDESYGFRALYDDSYGDYRINLPTLTSSRIQQPTFTSTLTGLGTFTLNNVKNIKIKGGYSNVIIANNFYSNTIGDSFNNNTINSNFYINTIENNFNANVIGGNFASNEIATSFYLNTISNNFVSNIINRNFARNTITDNFVYNMTSNNFTSNTVGSSFNSNVIGNNFDSNIIGNSFNSNTIANYFNSNNIGSFFGNNTIGNIFEGNTIGYGFALNTSEDNINGIDFTSSTHVYSGYSTTLFKNAALSQRLRYFNSSDQLVITDPTA